MTKVEYWRIKRGMTQTALSARSGVSLGSINRIEKHGRVPYGATFGKLAQALEVDPMVLMVAQAPAAYVPGEPTGGDIDDDDDVS